MHLVWYLQIFASYYEIAIIASYSYIFQGWWSTAQEITCQGITCHYFSLQTHMQSLPLHHCYQLFWCSFLPRIWIGHHHTSESGSGVQYLLVSPSSPQSMLGYIKHEKQHQLPFLLQLNQITSSSNNRIHPVHIGGILSKRCMASIYIQQLKLKFTHLQQAAQHVFPTVDSLPRAGTTENEKMEQL